MCIRAVTLATLVSALAAGEEVKGRGTSIDDGPKFNVQLLNGALRRPPAGRSIVMTKKNGKRYRCHLPSTSTSGAAEETSGTPPSTPPLTSYLQQLKNTQAVWKHNVQAVGYIPPILQILNVVHESWVVKEAVLREIMEVLGVRKCLHEFKFSLES
jgi:hypothetical protein